ncbi:unnamed protein product [Heterobilharzia americana]|nr:unnamed protein product [Heterobilharzia americana]CAH8627707.1 unnamed protein product [Heterobilharzia americana]
MPVSNKMTKKDHRGWQFALKKITLCQMTLPEITSPNCRSSQGKVDNFQSLIPFNVHRNILLPETWLYELYDNSFISLNGLIILRQDGCSSTKKNGGGAVTYISTH